MENRVAQSNYKVSNYAYQSLCNSPNRGLMVDWSSGLVAGFASATICAPLDISRTRHMLLATTKSRANIDYKGFFHTASRIYRDEGIRGLYKGYSVTAVSIPTFHSLYFALFYKTKDTLSKMEMFQNSEVLRNIIASFGVGIVCNTLTNPLWVVRTRIQSQFLHQDTMPKYTSLFGGLNRICKDEGFKALFKGLGASYFGLSHAVILYPLYEYLKTVIKEWKGTPSTSDIFLASLVSKFTAMVLTYPHIVLRTRLQDHRAPSFIRRTKQAHALANSITSEKATISSIIKNTYRNEGIKGFYAGLRIDLVRVLPANSIMFVVFEFVRKHLEQHLDETDY
jgi:solute carrier family 25 folate transporter 32